MAVTDFSAGDLSPLFTTNVADSTTTPALTFDLSDASPYTVFGNNTNANASPAFFAPILASALFENQGTTTTVLHGNASGNPSWGAVDLENDVTGTLPVADGGTGAAAFTEGSIVFAGTSGVYTENNANLFWDDGNAKLNLGAPAGTAGALNIGPEGIYAYRSAGRHIRFNANGLLNDFESKGANLVINFGIYTTPDDVSIFEGAHYSGGHGGRFAVGYPPQSDTRFSVQGATNDSSAFAIKAYNSSNSLIFSIRNDGNFSVLGSLDQGTVTSAMLKADSSGTLVAAVAGTDYVQIASGSGSNRRVPAFTSTGGLADTSIYTYFVAPGSPYNFVGIDVTGQPSAGTGFAVLPPAYFYDNVIVKSLTLNVNSGSPYATPKGYLTISTLGLHISPRVIASGQSGAPASSGDTQANGSLRLTGVGSTVVDLGVNGTSYTWIQATNSADLSVNYPLYLNPNGGGITLGGALVGNSATFSNNVEITTSGEGLILKDTGDGSRRRVTVVNGVLTVSAPL